MKRYASGLLSLVSALAFSGCDFFGPEESSTFYPTKSFYVSGKVKEEKQSSLAYCFTMETSNKLVTFICNDPMQFTAMDSRIKEGDKITVELLRRGIKEDPQPNQNAYTIGLDNSITSE